MAILNVSPVTKASMDATIKATANEMERVTKRWEDVDAWFLRLVDEDLTSLGYDANTITYIRSFAVACRNMKLFYRGQTLANTDIPSTYARNFVDPII